MFKRRKDSNGHVLRDGESERSDGRYQFRYLDLSNTRRTIYASTLAELREKERNIPTDNLCDQDDSPQAACTVSDLLHRYADQKRNSIRRSTWSTYSYCIKLVTDRPFGTHPISSIKRIDAKHCLLTLKNDGLSSGTVHAVYVVLRGAFELALDDEMLTTNPFAFAFGSVIKNDASNKDALLPHQQAAFLNCLIEAPTQYPVYDWAVVLLGTGLRISEFCGLTIHDIDFKRHCIRVDHQLSYDRESHVCVVTPTKARASNRLVPMSDDVERSIHHLISMMPETKRVSVGSVTDFIACNTQQGLLTEQIVYTIFRRAVARYNASHMDQLPNITPHILRHTFCSNMAQAGMGVKNLQYIMGHATSKMTLDRYTHTTESTAMSDFYNVQSTLSSQSGLDTSFDTNLSDDM